MDEIGEALPALKAAGRGAYCATLFIGDAVVLVSHKEALLESSGFKATPADTPERQALLTSLPAREIVAGGYGTYVYVDPLVCNCLYIGSDAAFSKYLGRVHFVGGSHGPPASINTVPHFSPPMARYGYPTGR